MNTGPPDPRLSDPHTDWIVFDRSWGVWSEPCATLEEAQEVSLRTGNGPIYHRTWAVLHLPDYPGPDITPTTF